LIIQGECRFLVTKIYLVCVLSHIHDQFGLCPVLIVAYREKLARIVLELVDYSICIAKWFDMAH
jgi:hypothetical protein